MTIPGKSPKLCPKCGQPAHKGPCKNTFADTMTSFVPGMKEYEELEADPQEEDSVLSNFVPGAKGGAGSGNWGHAGRPGKEGGSSPATFSKSAGGAHGFGFHIGVPGQRGGSAPSEDIATTQEGRKLTHLAKTHGGFTYHPIHKDSPTSGFAVALHGAGRIEKKIKAAELTPKMIEEYIDSRASIFKQYPNAHVGGWYNRDDGNIYLDISLIHKDRAEAMKTARAHKQLAIFDLGAMEEIKTEAESKEFSMDTKKKEEKKPEEKGKKVRFDFPTGATPQEIFDGLKKMIDAQK